MSNTNYKEKALKYRLKYFELKKQLDASNFQTGGDPTWYATFDQELKNIYPLVNGSYGDVVLTGSGVIAFLLKKLNMNKQLDDLELNDLNPHDLDFLYVSRLGARNPDTLGDYNLNQAQKSASSVTFKLQDGIPDRYIQSFDVTKIPNVKSFDLDGLQIINLNTLKGFYRPEHGDNDAFKEKKLAKNLLITNIIEKINTDNRNAEFGLVKEEPTSRYVPIRFGLGPGPMFSDDSDQENDDETSNKKPRGLFGDMSDDDEPKKGLFGDMSDDDEQAG